MCQHPPPRLVQHPRLHPVQSSLFMNCAAIFQLQFELPFVTASLHFASLWLAFIFFSFSLRFAVTLHLTGLQFILAAFCWPFIMLCYLAVNLCLMHVANFRDRSNKLGNSASLMYFNFDSICLCLCVTISRVSQCVCLCVRVINLV